MSQKSYDQTLHNTWLLVCNVMMPSKTTYSFDTISTFKVTKSPLEQSNDKQKLTLTVISDEIY